jgi:hypothetical protein
MSKIILITLTIILAGCIENKPEATYPTSHPQGVIITEEGSVIFYHEMWNTFTGMMYNL